jgi:hypothetical protein
MKRPTPKEQTMTISAYTQATLQSGSSPYNQDGWTEPQSVFDRFGIPKTVLTDPLARIPDGEYPLFARSETGKTLQFTLRKAGRNQEIRLDDHDIWSGVRKDNTNVYMPLGANHDFVLLGNEIGLYGDGTSTGLKGTVAMAGDLIHLTVTADTTYARETITERYYSDSIGTSYYPQRGFDYRSTSPVTYEAFTSLEGRDVGAPTQVVSYRVSGGPYVGTATLRTLSPERISLLVELKGKNGTLKFGVPVQQGGKIEFKGGDNPGSVLNVTGKVEQSTVLLQVTKGSVQFNDRIIISGSVCP